MFAYQTQRDSVTLLEVHGGIPYAREGWQVPPPSFWIILRSTCSHPQAQSPMKQSASKVTGEASFFVQELMFISDDLPVYLGNVGLCVLTTARTDHLPNFLTSRGPLVQPGSLERAARQSGGEFWGLALQLQPLQPCSVAQSPARPRPEAGDWGSRRLPGSRPSPTKGSRVPFCLCHLPSHLQGSQDGFIRFLNSFQLSLITLQVRKSSQAGADRG